jgi:hypothetical protein
MRSKLLYAFLQRKQWWSIKRINNNVIYVTNHQNHCKCKMQMSVILCSHGLLIHRGDPNFNIACGIEGCYSTFRRFSSFTSHISRKHVFNKIQNVSIQIIPNRCTKYEQNPPNNKWLVAYTRHKNESYPLGTECRHTQFFFVHTVKNHNPAKLSDFVGHLGTHCVTHTKW